MDLTPLWIGVALVVAGGAVRLAYKGARKVLLWLVKQMVDDLIAILDKRLGLDGLRDNLNPGPEAWPNGSRTLPEFAEATHIRLGRMEQKMDEHMRRPMSHLDI